MRVTLSPGRERPIRDGHPWVFSGAIQSEHGDREAAVASVFDAQGARLGSGFYSPGSQIRVRMLGGDPLSGSPSHAPAGVDAAYFEARLRAADGWRQRLLPAGTTGYRLLNAEGDGLPGWTVDRFGSVLVSQITSAGLEKLRGPAYEALARLFPGSPDSAPRRSRGPPRRGAAARGGDDRRPSAARGRVRRERPEVRRRARGRPEDRLLLRPARQPAAGRELRARSPRARPLLAQRRVRALCPARPRPRR